MRHWNPTPFQNHAAKFPRDPRKQICGGFQLEDSILESALGAGWPRFFIFALRIFFPAAPRCEAIFLARRLFPGTQRCAYLRMRPLFGVRHMEKSEVGQDRRSKGWQSLGKADFAAFRLAEFIWRKTFYLRLPDISLKIEGRRIVGGRRSFPAAAPGDISRATTDGREQPCFPVTPRPASRSGWNELPGSSLPRTESVLAGNAACPAFGVFNLANAFQRLGQIKKNIIDFSLDVLLSFPFFSPGRWQVSDEETCKDAYREFLQLISARPQFWPSGSSGGNQRRN